MFLVAFIAIILVATILYYTLTSVIEFYRCKIYLSFLPGPKMQPILGHMLHFRCDDATLFKKLRKWSLDYYPVYNLTMGFVSTANISGPEDFELVAATTKNIQKGRIYTFLDRWLGEGLLTSTGGKWQTRRKILTTAFHFNILQQFVIIFNNETRNLISVLKKECHKPEINLIPHISQFTLCTINETSMGTSLNLNNEEDQTYWRAIHRIGKIFVYRLSRPWLYFPTIYYNIAPTGLNERSLIQTLHYFTNKIIKEKSKHFEKFEMADEDFNYAKRKKLAMLDLLLNAKIDGLIDEKGIQDEVNTFMFEGHDTTSMSICFTLMLLASHKEVQEQLLQEIHQVIGISEQPTYNDLQELKYMERVIKESLRLYPSVPFIARILEEDVTTSTGYLLPKGCEVNIHIYDILRNPKIWPDPEKFDPDRFLPENCKDRHPFAYVPFSAGPRNCIGQRFAILEIKAVLCGILRNFILEPVDTPETIKFVPDIVLRSEKGTVLVKLTPRT